MKKIRIDPRIFISSPYIVCPECKKDDSFGVLNIHGNSYTRRCRECWVSKSYKLPELKKKIIYLDQFVISEMMKAINDKLGKKDKIDKFYFTLFEKLEELSKAQLIVCPDSTFHKNESLLSGYYASLKQMYEHFSNGATFYDPATIRRFQITDCFRSFLDGKGYFFDKQHSGGIMERNINGWRDKFRISVDFKIKDEEIKSIRDSKLKVHESISGLFEEVKKQKDKKFRDWVKEEGLAWGRTMVNQYISSIMKQDPNTMSIDEMLLMTMSEPSILFTSLIRYVNSDKYEEKFKKVSSFLVSEEILELPFNKLSSLIWACIEYSTAHGGRKNPPNMGMVNDIDMVSTLLPYCDVMFVDNDMFNILNHSELKSEINKYGTKIFSKTNKKEFFKYLDDIKDNAGEEHIKKVIEVYGNEWATPYWEMYKT